MTVDENRLSFQIPQIIGRNQNLINSFIDSMYVYADDSCVYSAEGRNDLDDLWKI